MSGFQKLQKPHVVLVPFPALGHSIPFLELSRFLASHGLTVSYVTNVSSVQESIFEAVSSDLDIRSVVLPTHVVEGLPDRHESSDIVSKESIGTNFESAARIQDSFSRWIEQKLEEEEASEGGMKSPVCVIYDMFIGWVVETARKYNIASFCFQTCGAFATSLLSSVSASILQNTLEKEGDHVILNLNLPQPLRLHRDEIPVNFLNPDVLSQPRLQFFVGRFQSTGESSGMLINTFNKLEPEYLQHLKNLTGKPVWAVGPVLPPKFVDGATKVSGRGKMADISEEELVRWLDSQRPRSIVYVSFGSRTLLSEQQANALARALEASGQPFVWAIEVLPSVEPATSESSDLASRLLPEGFEERTKDRGVLIWGWAPQLLILSHLSVGAFMSHCGWNSTLESITLGVPLISWPMSGDQHFNSKLVADLGVGVQFCQHKDAIPDEKKVEEVVKVLLGEEKGKDMRRRAEKLKQLAIEACEEGGSSQIDLQAFVSHMHKLSMRPGRGKINPDKAEGMERIIPEELP